ncbi:MAG: glycosyltransferase [Symplocastrum torsivum CPER-KK1]|jgi:glycosyltransferase involved in cell wall biosynthesis|uniref:Glycosyltransferase n=1 Tax=Symplocastrum torsivum CPER-KK1 TaxID=450513 RepID=A0A951U7Q5_9CYAN|nr:glycosyltransferase [Symplocastrum torsivum CPER-KK1]
MKRLLFITTIPSTLYFLAPIARHFRAKGWRVDAMAKGISTSTETCLDAFERRWDVEWSRNPLDLRNFLSAPQQVLQVCTEQEYDLVHVSTPVAAFISRYALKDWRKKGKQKVIYTAHGFHFYSGGALLKNAIFLGLEWLAGHWTDYLVVINHEDEQAAKRYSIVRPEQVRYMPGIGVDAQYYNPSAVSEMEVEKLRQDLGLTPEIPLFLSLSEFIPRKRNEDILRAFARLAHSEAHLAFAGEGPLLEEMQHLASKLGIQHQVHFLGFRQDVPVLIRASVATLLSSSQEGLPRSVMESMSLEIPVIGTEIRGTRDLLEGGYGILVKVGDVEGLTQAMAWVLDHPKEAQATGRRGRERITHYELQLILKLHETLYAEALDAEDRVVSYA